MGGEDLVLRLSPEKPKEGKEVTMKTMKKSLSMVGAKTAECVTTQVLKRTRSLRSVKNKRKHSNEENEENIDFALTSDEKKARVDEIEIPVVEEKTSNVSEAALSKLAGVRSLITTAVWGVPYAKVVEDLDISACEPEVQTQDKSGANQERNCVIS